MDKEFHSAYSQKLRNPLWEQKRIEILTRDLYTCVHCRRSDETLHVHHLYYLPDHEPWQYENNALITLCEVCHIKEHMHKVGYKESLPELLEAGFSYELLNQIHFAMLYAANLKEPTSIASHLYRLFTDHEFISEIKKH